MSKVLHFFFEAFPYPGTWREVCEQLYIPTHKKEPMGTFKNLLSIQSLKIPFIGIVIVPVMCILSSFQLRLRHMLCESIPSYQATKNFRKGNRLRIQENTTTSGAIVLKFILVILYCILMLIGRWSPCERKTGGKQKTCMIIQRQLTPKMVFHSVLNVRKLIWEKTQPETWNWLIAQNLDGMESTNFFAKGLLHRCTPATRGLEQEDC